MSALLTSPSAFAPRKEFLKNQNTPHQFALLTFNGAEILRLSNFPPNVISSLRTLFQQQSVYRAYREDPEMGVSEFIMADRLWNGKNLRTERLVVLIFSTILSHRFKYVTTLAYGRLAQDTRSLVFSKAMPFPLDVPSTSRTNSPAVPASPLPMSSPSIQQDGSRPEQQRTCFALSLTQKTLRVICAPKSSTPAILASVRSAWPRGVVSEGRPEDDVYEFQLKGYSLFSTSTFDRDALVHIFGLLRALDTHAFQLITNLNLTHGIAKSRTKDLWIFDCPADPPSPPHSQHSPSIGGGGQPSPHSSLLGVPKGKDPERVMSVATGTTAGMAGLGAASNGYYATPEGQAHIRAATAPSPLSKEQRISTDSDADGVFAAHTRAATSPMPSMLEKRPSVLRKPPPGAWGVGEKPKRKNSTGSMASINSSRSKQGPPPPVEAPPVVRPPEDPNPLPPPPPFSQEYSYQSHGTAGPLSESEYAYGYSGVYDSGVPKHHPDSEYMYKQYVPPPPPPPHHHGAAIGPALIYSTTHSNENHSSESSAGPQSPGTEEGLLSADAFRETAYSGTSDASRDVPATWTNSTPVSPTDSEHTHRRQDARGQDRQQVTPRTAHVPLPQQPEMSMQYTGMEGRPKSEKAFMGIIPPPPLSTYPVPSAVPVPIPASDERPGAPHRMETAASAATVLPPGGYPKTPMESSSSVKIVPVEKVVPSPVSSPSRQRQQSAGKTKAAAVPGASGVGRSTSSKKSGTAAAGVQETLSESPSSKGWVLVNVEPSRKASLDAAVAAMDAAAANARVRNKSTSSGVALNTGTAPGVAGSGMVTEGVLMESPIETFPRRAGNGASPIRDDTIDSLDSPVDQRAAGTEEYAAAMSSSGPDRRKGSLKKKQRSGSSDDSAKKKKFLGLFSIGGHKDKSSTSGHRKMASAPTGLTMMAHGGDDSYEVASPTVGDDRLDERDDTAGAVDGVKESTWGRVRDPKTPTPVSKLTIG
ncbi:hypothetical protein FRB90_009169 [Tulasnella sp. 427]|nr:hypothetical protein FRB90_009169 [Tulasnella sp. 427]